MLDKVTNKSFTEPNEARRDHGSRRVLDRVEVTIPLDPYFTLAALSQYSGLANRTLRKWMADPMRPLPVYRVGGKLLVRVSEFDAWVSGFRADGGSLKAMVDDVMSKLEGDRSGRQG